MKTLVDNKTDLDLVRKAYESVGFPTMSLENLPSEVKKVINLGIWQLYRAGDPERSDICFLLITDSSQSFPLDFTGKIIKDSSWDWRKTGYSEMQPIAGLLVND